MKKEQGKDKMQITKRFIAAIDYLLDSNQVKTQVEIASQLKMTTQKITSMKSYVEGRMEDGQYPTITNIQTLNQAFSVSFDFIFKGEMPILVEDLKPTKVDVNIPEQINSKILEMSEGIQLLREKVSLLNEKVDFYKEIVNRKI